MIYFLYQTAVGVKVIATFRTVFKNAAIRSKFRWKVRKKGITNDPVFGILGIIFRWTLYYNFVCT